MKPTFATKVTDSICKWVSPQYTIDCFADISTQELCTVTQKLDLDQMSERSIRILKVTNMTKLTFCCKFWVYSLRMTQFGRFWWYLWSVTSYGWFWRYSFVACYGVQNVPGLNFRPPHWILPFISLFLHVTVRRNYALYVVDKVPPGIIYAGGKFIHLENLLFTLSVCVTVFLFCFLLKISDTCRFIFMLLY